MSSKPSSVESILKKLSSNHITEHLESIRNEPGESMEALSSQTPVMILQSIQGECKRTADTTMEICEHIKDIKATMTLQQEQILNLSSSINDLVSILASNSIKASSRSTEQSHSLPAKDYYYRAKKIKNKFDAITCIISHLINMVYLHMENKGVLYPDGTSPDFTEFVNIVQVVCTEKCLISTVEHSMPISVSDKSKPVMESIYDYIASKQKSVPATLTESNMKRIYNDATREDIFVHVRYVMERLTYLNGILPPRQIDAIKCIGYPIAIGAEDEPLRLNYDSSIWKPRRQHEVTNMVLQLQSRQKMAYVRQIMAGKSVGASYQFAYNFKGDKRVKGSKNIKEESDSGES